MGSSRLILVTLAMIVCASIDCVTSSIDTNFSMMKVVDNFMCNFHKSSDDPSSCLLGGKLNDCGAYKCYKTIGQQCAPKRTDAQLTGARCGHNLNCGKFLRIFIFFYSDFNTIFISHFQVVIRNVKAAWK